MSEQRARRLLLESVVIVASILLAFAIDAAWERRTEAESEAKVLEALEAEFRDYAAELVATERSNASKEQAVRALLELTGPDPAPVSDTLAFRRNTAVALYTLRPSIQGGTFQGLVGADGFVLIQDPELRRLLGEWAQSVDVFELNSTFAEDFSADFRRYMVAEGVLREVDIYPAGASRFDADYEGLLADPQFENHLVTAAFIARTFVDTAPTWAQLATDIADRIAQVR